MTYVYLALCLAVFLAYFWIKSRFEAWRITRREVRKLRAQGAARTRRTAVSRVLSLLPVGASQWLFRWPAARRTRPFVAPVVIARRGILGRRERIRLNQHVLIAGQTGSGKSSTQRVIAAHVLQAVDACLEVWDLKRISALRDYRGRARTCVTVAEVAERLRDLVGREFTERADRLIDGDDVPYLVIMVDEAATLLRELDGHALRDFFGAVEMGRELRVFFVLAVQHPLADTIPTQLRSQLPCVIAHRLKSAKESEVVFPGQVSAGWSPHLLGGPGSCLVWTHDRTPRVLFGLWLSPGRMRDVVVRGPMSAMGPGVDLTKGVAVAPVAHASDLGGHARNGNSNTRSDAFADEIERALLGGPAGVREIARTTGRNPGSVHRKITQLAARGLVEETPSGWTLPHVNEQQEDLS